MKKSALIILMLIYSNIIYSQENFKKCNTTRLVNTELKNNTDYVNARARLLNFNLVSFLSYTGVLLF